MLFVPEEGEVVRFRLEGDAPDNATWYEAEPPSSLEVSIAGAMDATALARENQKLAPHAGMDAIGRNIRRMAESEIMRRAAKIKRIINAYPDGAEITDPVKVHEYVKRLLPAQQNSLKGCLEDAAYLDRLIFRDEDVVRPGDRQATAEKTAGEETQGCGAEGIEIGSEPIAV